MTSSPSRRLNGRSGKRQGKMPKLGVVMDPIAGIHPNKDTTLGLLEAAQRRGWPLTYFEPGNLYLHDGVARGNGRGLEVNLNPHGWFLLDKPRDVALSDLDVILMRQDPPLDEEFLHTCHVLEYAMHAGVLIVNNPQSVRLTGEKMFAQEFADLGPPTLVTRDRQRITRFVEEHEDTVIKPINDMGGTSVFRLNAKDSNADLIIETLTCGGRRTVMTQQLIRDYEKGDKRILLVDGEPVPFALTRVPPPGRLRANLAAGGRGEVSKINDRDREICTRLAPRLRELELMFVGLDVIDGQLTEINVSSPTCMREINNECNLDVGTTLMDAIETRLAS